MTPFTHFYVLAIGAFIIGGAHYIRNGDDGWYVAWIFLAVALTMVGRFLDNPSKAT